MIRFADKLDKTESAEFPEQSKFKEIKPILKTSDDKVQDYWNDVFSDDKCKSGHRRPRPKWKFA